MHFPCLFSSEIPPSHIQQAMHAWTAWEIDCVPTHSRHACDPHLLIEACQLAKRAYSCRPFNMCMYILCSITCRCTNVLLYMAGIACWRPYAGHGLCRQNSCMLFPMCKCMRVCLHSCVKLELIWMYANLCKIFIYTSVSEAGLQFDMHMLQEAVCGFKVPCSSTS
jgi:hypothetical protein